MTKPSVSLCMIVKDEEQNLPGCLESVRGLVDEIIVVDTGSNDATIAVAQSHGASVHSIPWGDDFASARNESLSLATCDWIFYLDPDERLDSKSLPDCIREAASDPGIDAWTVNIKNYKPDTEAFDTTANIRLFRRLPEVRFENEVHERVEPSLARIGARIDVAPFSIDHFGYSLAPDALNAKLERNLALSRKHLERRPDDPYCLYYVGITLLLLGKNEESRLYFRKALEAEDLPLFLNAMLRNLAAYLNLLQGKPDDALSYAIKSLELVPRQNTAYLLSGLAHFNKSDFESALPLLEQAREFLLLSPEKRQTDLSQEYAFIDEAEFQNLIGICQAETNRFAEAIPHFRKYMELRGNDSESLRRAGICSINVGEFEGGMSFLQQAEALGAPRSELALPKAFACLRLKDFDRAESLLAEAENGAAHDRETISKIRRLLEAERKATAISLPETDKISALPGISLCMIVKNEEQRLSGCLESVRGMVDEIVVVDTGSSDKTTEVAESFGAKVFSHPWTGDFSEARNESLRHATRNWIIFLDADERLDPGGEMDCLRKPTAIPGIDAYYVPILNRGSNGKQEPTVGSAIRFFRNIPGIKFSGRVHEGVDRFLIRAGAKAAHGTFAIDHYGYGQDPAIVESKYRRNLELLEKELAENPDNAHARYHLGLTCMALGRESEARWAFDRALLGKGLTPALKAMVLNMKGYHHLRAGELYPALYAASQSLSIVPVQNTARLLKGLALFRKGSYTEALPLLLEAYGFLSLPVQERKSDISYEDSIEKNDLIEIIGTCFSETSKYEEAVPFLKLTAHLKEDPAIFERLGISLLNIGEFKEAARYLEKALAAGGSPGSLALPLSFACLRTGDFSRAAEYFCRAEPRAETEISVAFKLIQAMAAEEGCHPYLSDCIAGKQDLLLGAFPDEFSRFIAQAESFARAGGGAAH